jgi:hypothetical protein
LRGACSPERGAHSCNFFLNSFPANDSWRYCRANRSPDTWKSQTPTSSRYGWRLPRPPVPHYAFSPFDALLALQTKGIAFKAHLASVDLASASSFKSATTLPCAYFPSLPRVACLTAYAKLSQRAHSEAFCGRDIVDDDGCCSASLSMTPRLMCQLYSSDCNRHRVWCRSSDTLPSGARPCSPLDPSTLPKSEPAHAGLGPSRQLARSPARPAHTPSRSVCRSSRCGPRTPQDLPTRSSRPCLRAPSVGAPCGDVPGSPEPFRGSCNAASSPRHVLRFAQVQRPRPQALLRRLFWPR